MLPYHSLIVPQFNENKQKNDRKNYFLFISSHFSLVGSSLPSLPSPPFGRSVGPVGPTKDDIEINRK